MRAGSLTTMTRQPWRLPPLGAKRAVSSRRASTSSGTGSGRNSRTAPVLRRVVSEIEVHELPTVAAAGYVWGVTGRRSGTRAGVDARCGRCAPCAARRRAHGRRAVHRRPRGGGRSGGRVRLPGRRLQDGGGAARPTWPPCAPPASTRSGSTSSCRARRRPTRIASTAYLASLGPDAGRTRDDARRGRRGTTTTTRASSTSLLADAAGGRELHVRLPGRRRGAGAAGRRVARAWSRSPPPRRRRGAACRPRRAVPSGRRGGRAPGQPGQRRPPGRRPAGPRAPGRRPAAHLVPLVAAGGVGGPGDVADLLWPRRRRWSRPGTAFLRCPESGAHPAARRAGRSGVRRDRGDPRLQRPPGPRAGQRHGARPPRCAGRLPGDQQRHTAAPGGRGGGR